MDSGWDRVQSVCSPSIAATRSIVSHGAPCHYLQTMNHPLIFENIDFRYTCMFLHFRDFGGGCDWEFFSRDTVLATLYAFVLVPQEPGESPMSFVPRGYSRLYLLLFVFEEKESGIGGMSMWTQITQSGLKRTIDIWLFLIIIFFDY